MSQGQCAHCHAPVQKFRDEGGPSKCPKCGCTWGGNFNGTLYGYGWPPPDNLKPIQRPVSIIPEENEIRERLRSRRGDPATPWEEYKEKGSRG